MADLSNENSIECTHARKEAQLKAANIMAESEAQAAKNSETKYESKIKEAQEEEARLIMMVRDKEAALLDIQKQHAIEVTEMLSAQVESQDALAEKAALAKALDNHGRSQAQIEALKARR